MKTWNDADYARIERALRYLDEHAARQPGLAEIARAAHLSEFHFQRLFRRWAGVTPKRFLQLVTLERAKRSLAGDRSVLDASWDAGLSGPGRLHDLFVALEAVSPGEFKARGAGLGIRYGFHASPFGRALIAVTARGVCHLAFLELGGDTAALASLQKAWPKAELAPDPAATSAVAARIFGPRGKNKAARPERVIVAGTNFQAMVWRALLAVPSGRVTTYGEIARRIGRPSAARAVGRAVGSNSIAFLIPCHRVIQGLGALGGYRWGPARKRVILAWEAARRERHG